MRLRDRSVSIQSHSILPAESLAAILKGWNTISCPRQGQGFDEDACSKPEGGACRPRARAGARWDAMTLSLITMWIWEKSDDDPQQHLESGAA